MGSRLRGIVISEYSVQVLMQLGYWLVSPSNDG